MIDLKEVNKLIINDAKDPFIDDIMIRYKVTNYCNFRCSYCVQLDKNTKSVTEDTFRDNLIKINKLINKLGRKCTLQLIGGEVTLYDLPKLIKYVDSQNISKVMIITNLSQSIDYFTNLFTSIESMGLKLQLIASCHEEFLPRNEFIGKIIYLSKIINKNYIKLQTKFVLNKSIDLSNEDFTRLVSNGITVDINLMRDPNTNLTNSADIGIGNKSLTKSFKAITDKGVLTGIDLHEYITNLSEIKNFNCDIFSRRLHIQPNGNIRMPCNDKVIGTLDDFDKLELPKYEKCNQDYLCSFCKKSIMWRDQYGQ